MLTKIKEFVKVHQADIILLIGVILISLLSFSIGYIVAKQQDKEPVRIEFRTESLEFRIVVDEADASSSPTELPLVEAKVKMRTKSSSPFANARL